jgi:hypothetical protein
MTLAELKRLVVAHSLCDGAKVQHNMIREGLFWNRLHRAAPLREILSKRTQTLTQESRRLLATPHNHPFHFFTVGY